MRDLTGVLKKSMESLTIWMYGADDQKLHHEIVYDPVEFYTALSKFIDSQWANMSITSYTNLLPSWLPAQVASKMMVKEYSTGSTHVTTELTQDTARDLLPCDTSMFSPSVRCQIAAIIHQGKELQRMIDTRKPLFDGIKREVFCDFHDELVAQYKQWGDRDRSLTYWVTIIAEELGKTAREILEGKLPKAYREAIQTAVAAFATAEQIKRNTV